MQWTQNICCSAQRGFRPIPFHPEDMECCSCPAVNNINPALDAINTHHIIGHIPRFQSSDQRTVMPANWHLVVVPEIYKPLPDGELLLVAVDCLSTQRDSCCGMKRCILEVFMKSGSDHFFALKS